MITICILFIGLYSHPDCRDYKPADAGRMIAECHAMGRAYGPEACVDQKVSDNRWNITYRWY